MPIDQKTMADRAVAKEAATTVYGLVADQLTTPERRLHFIRKMTQLLQADPAAPAGQPVPLAQLKGTRLEFGQYAGQTYDEIPLAYLDWLLRQHEETGATLRAYLQHPDNDRNE